MKDPYALIGLGPIDVASATNGTSRVPPGTAVDLTGNMKVSLSPLDFTTEYFEISLQGQPRFTGWVEEAQLSSAMRAPYDFEASDAQVARYAIDYTSHDCDLIGFKTCKSITLGGYSYAECYQSEDWTVFQFSHIGLGLGVRPTVNHGDCSIGKQTWVFAYPGQVKSLQQNQITVEKQKQEFTFVLPAF